MSFCIDIPDNANVEYVKIARRTCQDFVGWPLVQRVTGFLYQGAVYFDKSLKVSANFTAKAWSLYYHNELTGHNSRYVPIGEVCLVVVYEDSGTYYVRGVAEMTTPMLAEGAYEHDCDLAVEAGDFIGLWVAEGSNFTVYADNYDDNPPCDLYYFNDADVKPYATQALGTSPSDVYATRMLSIAVRSDVEGTPAYETNNYRCVGADRGPFLFELGVNAWADGNVVDAANALNDNSGNYAYVADGNTGYIYCQLASGVNNRMLERIRLQTKQYGAGVVTVYCTGTDAVGSLAGAEGIAEGDWQEIVTIPGDFDDDTSVFEWCIHVGIPTMRWYRIKIEASGANQRVYQFASFHMGSITDDTIDLTPHDGLLHRIWVTSDLVTLKLTAAVGSGDSEAQVDEATVTELGYFDPGEYVYLRHANNQYKRLVLDNPATETGPPKKLKFTTTVGEAFNLGESADQQLGVFQVEAYDANDNLVSTSPWLCNYGAFDVRLGEYADA